MSKTLAIFGAGPVLGRSLARRFGREGFRIALIARTRPKLDALATELARLAEVVDEITAHFGQIDVVEFSPGGGSLGEGIVSVLDVDPGNLQSLLDQFLIPAVTLVRAVLPGMITRRDGAILFTAGQSGIYPKSRMGSVPHRFVSGSLGADFHGEVIHPDTYAQHFWDRYAKRGKPEVLVGNFAG